MSMQAAVWLSLTRAGTPSVPPPPHSTLALRHLCIVNLYIPSNPSSLKLWLIAWPCIKLLVIGGGSMQLCRVCWVAMQGWNIYIDSHSLVRHRKWFYLLMIKIDDDFVLYIVTKIL